MSLDPKNCGACYYCKYCADLGTQTKNGEAVYLRKCSNQNLADVAPCVATCYYFEPDTAKPVSDKKPNNHLWMIIAGIVAAVAIIAIVLVVVLSGRSDSKGGGGLFGGGKNDAAELNGAINELDGLLGGSNKGEDKNAVADRVESVEDQTQQNTPALPDGEVLFPFSYPSNARDIYIVVTAKDPLNVRDVPGDFIDSKVIDTVPRYAAVTATEYMGEWTKIKYGSIEGYSSTAYLKCINELTMGVLSHGGKPVELLKNAKEDSVVQKTLASGTEVLVIAKTKNGDYTKIYIDGSTYWVRTGQIIQ